ncbi:MAG: hypothetical protein KDB71_05035 [Mycobacterium sp.]|nr:hypothetical protein [Mycobacterium sp.]
MSATVVYEIARFGTEGGDSPPYRVQLLVADDGYRLRDTDGHETPCEGTDIAAVIASTPALREIREGDQTEITSGVEIEARLPLLLIPVGDVGGSAECHASVNGADWTSGETVDGDFVMLPGYWGEGEEVGMNPCWAEGYYQQGQSWCNPLIGWTSIGLATPAVVVEYARHDYGGFGGGSAIAIRPFDDFATVFVDWLLNANVLEQIWKGDSPPYAPAAQLFSDAVVAGEHRGYWDNDQDENQDCVEDDDGADFASASLELHLPQDLIDRVRARLCDAAPG